MVDAHERTVVTAKKPPGRSRRGRSSGRGRRRAAEAGPAADEAPGADLVTTEEVTAPAGVVEEQLREVVAEVMPPTTVPEPAFAARVLPPAPRPVPFSRRAVFFDVENTSRPEHVAHVLAHLALDRIARATDLVAVGNWRVVSHETARFLARNGAQLVHSAPAVGVRDWSDLRIAVAAGVWLASARPGDTIEVVTDDQAFDAVGDVATSMGVGYRRLSFRALAGIVGELPPEEREQVAEGRSRRRGRSGRRGGRRGAPGPVTSRARVGNGVEPERGSQTAPHDELLAVVRDLIDAAPDRSVSLDALSNALKAHGFSRPPGSPRLITRLRRIKEIEVSRAGTIRLVDGAAAGTVAETPDEMPYEAGANAAAAEPGSEAESGEGSEIEPASEEQGAASPARSGSRRRRRRGGRRRRGRGGQTVAAPP